jgi:hypothetical protein
MKIGIKVAVTLRGANGVNFTNVVIGENDLLELAKKKALEQFTEGYYDTAECEEIDGIEQEY